ncbi:amidase signature enzyme [Lentithecium fluviatile CBS 122367]|uniref:Amidase signature enzyme n=1 Tax=Lentithecium fluviatile CBS 122367 TaxID=1168545 RepID=A0A6G1JMW7_9PLEO|nr:amidase signature enzyme [Lentithecium fluviatile CBS 122367]
MFPIIASVLFLTNYILAATLTMIICRRIRSLFACTRTPKIPSLLNVTLSELAEGLERGHFTSVDLVKAYLLRIKEVDHEFHSIIETNPDALSIAHELDGERQTTGSRGPIHGVPILLKDNIVTLDGVESTCDSYALVGAKPPAKSEVVTALRRAGIIILGKANMAQWSGFRSISGCSGWSARGGQCTGPFWKGMKASGSSSGITAATTLGLGLAALGTEICYSIVSPAERSGVVGFKPTKDIIPSNGIIFASKRLDTVGLITRTVEGAARIFGEITVQGSDEHTRAERDEMRRIINTFCSSTNLSGLRIGIPSNIAELKNIHPAKTLAFKKALYVIEALGADIVEDVEIPGAEEFANLPAETKQLMLDTNIEVAINTYLSNLTTNPQDITNLEDLIAYTNSHPKERYPKRNVAVLERALVADPNDAQCKEMVAREGRSVPYNPVNCAVMR